jgi:pimeloyl-ACP methyl ester carboxylesterase
MRSLPDRYSSAWVAMFDGAIIFGLLLGSLVLTATASFNAADLLRFRRASPPPGNFFVVNGRSMHLNCAGAGSPTIVLESGLGNDGLIWGAVQPQLAQTTRVCSYDRAGLGWSEQQPGPRDADHIAVQLHQLLQQAGIDGPIVLMGHSVGGMYIRDYAARFPNHVAGLVFVDGSTPLQDLDPALKAAGETGYARWASLLLMRSATAAGLSRLAGACGRPMKGFDGQAGRLLSEDLCYPQFNTIAAELASFNASGRESAQPNHFGALPVLIFSQDADKVLKQTHDARQIADMEVAWTRMQENLKKLSPRSRRISAKGSSHAIQVDRPDLLLKEVPLFIEQVRGSAPEPERYGSTVVE